MKIVLAVAGSSGAIYAKVLLDKIIQFKEHQWALVLSENANTNWALEIPDTKIMDYDIPIYAQKDFNAPFASGSSKWDAMIVCPCSAGFMARVAHGFSDGLMSRAADVMLKERKKLVLVLRETPFSLIHIENMKKITLAGGIICPAIPSFYAKPKTPEAIVETVIDRVLDLIGLEHKAYRWGDE